MPKEQQPSLDVEEQPTAQVMGADGEPQEIPLEPAASDEDYTPESTTPPEDPEPGSAMELAAPRKVFWRVTDQGEKKYVTVPGTLNQLAVFLDWTKTQKQPAPFRASYLPAALRRALYLWSGIPETIEPAYVYLFAGRGYIAAEGAIQAAIKQENFLGITAKMERSVPCTDPASGCKMGAKAGQDSRRVIYSCTIVLAGPANRERRITMEHAACMHDTQTDRIQKVAQTRACRTSAVLAIGLSEETVYMPSYDTLGQDRDEPVDAELVGEPAVGQAS